ncbi:hypothetical protein BGZ80_006607 [Entomortierella chlamydospora]|uniref:LIM zinc-binding domain-containing protein n=1 Tax=Entomortierella chlamydospora TaxID=101097 RepID=A0A9P6MYT5_9FUNG|nr:hypothetical protein BGZ80_006607 [Entomortierella chlamydospora]
MPPRFVPNVSPKCPRCSKSVYSAEQIIGPNGGAWHKSAYCKSCHKKMWGPTGYGYASGLLVREDPESQFKQGIGRPTNTSNIDEVANHSTGGSNSGRQGGYNSPGLVQDEETEEQRHERLIPVNATLKKRNSLDMIREQAEASRRAYDEAHAQRVANRYGQVNTNVTGGSTTSTGSKGDLFSASNNSGYLSDSSSAFGSAIATTSSPAPSISSISSATSSQPATRSLYLNQSIKPSSITPPSSHQESQDAESEFAKSRQALSFQTGAPTTTTPTSTFNSALSAPPSLPKRDQEPISVASSVRAADDQPDDSYLEYVPIRVVARKEESSNPVPATSSAPAVGEEEWDAEPVQKKPGQPMYLSQYLKQQRQQEQAREQAPVSSPAPPPSASARLNQLINETDKLNLREQEERQRQAQTTSTSVANDEWDEEPTPTVPSRPQNVSYMPARNVSSAATRTWTPTANTSTEETSSNNYSRTDSAGGPVGSNTFNSTPKTSYYRTGSVMTPKKTFSFGGGGDICPRCQKTVYHAESALAPGGSKYHKLCLRCVECSKSLDSTNMTDRQGTPYCKTCYGKAFGAKGYGYGSGASMLHTEL